MEKHTPHYDLAVIQALIAQKGIFTFTRTARLGFSDMGLSEAEALQVLLSLRKTMLYKSMTTHQGMKHEKAGDFGIRTGICRILCTNASPATLA